MNQLEEFKKEKEDEGGVMNVWIVTLEDARDGECVRWVAADTPGAGLKVAEAVFEQLAPMFEDKRAGLKDCIQDLRGKSSSGIFSGIKSYLHNYDDIYLCWEMAESFGCLPALPKKRDAGLENVLEAIKKAAVDQLLDPRIKKTLDEVLGEKE
tara:strand:- start:636 stop:1094 length:459 start_codon:yes stop_codon:yes gene_type:complete